MALSIGCKNGDKIRVGSTLIHVVRIKPDNVIDLNIEGVGVVSISDAEKTEILPSVFASCGFSGPNHERYSRIAFEAPRSIRIERVKA